jgi:dynein heavy chain, axonemal
MVYKIFRGEKLILLIKNFVLHGLGKIFIESPGFDLKGSFTDSTPTTPIIFVLSPGADPISYLLTLAKEK